MIRVSCSFMFLIWVSSVCSFQSYAQESSDNTIVEQEIEANSETDADKPCERDKDGRCKEIDEITITGSRIQRTTFNTMSPVQIINSEKSSLAGLIDPADILQGSSIAAGQQIDDSFSGFVTDGGPGANTISLRGLGAQRTLVLVNGKRWGPSGVRGSVSSVDLSALPASTISRYEILKDGASSVYGADAVAGVVNAITKERQDGFQLNMQTILPSDGGGDGYVIDGVWGTIGDDWSFNFAAGYAHQKEMNRDDRKWSACDEMRRTVDTDDDGNLQGYGPDGQPLCFGFIYGLATSPFGFARYDPSLDPSATPANPNYDPDIQGFFGIPYFTTIPEGPLDNQGAFYNDTLTYGQWNIIPDTERYSITSYADKDINLFGGTSSLYYEFYFNKRKTISNGGYRQFFPYVPETNPSNPFGLNGPLAGLGGFGVQPVLPSYQLQDPEYLVEVKRHNTFFGLKGDLFSEWSYDAYVGYSRSKGTYTEQSWLDDRVNASADAVDDGFGNLVCADLVNFPGCIAPNFFSEAALLYGRLPQDYLNWITKKTEGSTVYERTQFSGYVTGPMFELPADPAMLVVGLEYRKDKINDKPDIDAQRDNIFQSSTAAKTVGDDEVTEVFVEAEFPLVARVPAVEEFRINLSFRYTDYDSYGSDNTYRFQANWQVIESLRLRASTGTSFRAPALFEQNLGDQTGFVDGLIDPCIDYANFYTAGDPIFDNCAAQGLPGDYGQLGVPGITAITGGNPDLEAETSDAWTAGLVITPPELGFSLSVSWYEIEIENTVESPSVSYILADCYTRPGLTGGFCSRIAPRDPLTDALTSVDASLLNVGLQETKGMDVNFLYEYEFPRFDFSFEMNLTHIQEQSYELFGEIYELEGRWGYPSWSGDSRFRIDYRDWTFNWDVDYIGSSEEDPVYVTLDGQQVANSVYKVDRNFYHSASVRYTSPSDWQIIGTLRNIFDEDPPYVGDNIPSDGAFQFMNTLPGTGYDLIGRMVVLQFAKSF